MSDSQPPTRQPNTLGKASLVLGILAILFVFSIGLCAGVANQQGWLQAVGTILFLLGGTFAFAGLIAAFLGFAGLFGKNRSRAGAMVGLILGVLALLLFAAVVNSVQ